MSRAEAPFPVLVLTGLALALAAPGCGAQSGGPLPDCVWCGATEAPDDLSARVALAGPEEPGRRLVVRGTVYEPDGETPASGVILYVYQTNDAGIYEKRGDEAGNGRRHGHLRGWVETDQQGRYTIRTILPGHYPSRSEARHIHLTVLEPDRAHEYTLPSFQFADDPFLDADPGAPNVLELSRDDTGVLHGRRDIVLPAAIEAVRTADGVWYRPVRDSGGAE